MEEKTARRFKMPHTYILLIIILTACAILTWVIPAGAFERVLDPELNRMVVIPNSYKQISPTPIGPWKLVLSIFQGMLNASEISFFIIFVTAYIMLLIKLGAINGVVSTIIKKLGKRDYLLIPISMILFGIMGSTFGVIEEFAGFIPAFVVIAISLGYDRVVGGFTVLLGLATGFAAAITNPFTVIVASNIAGVAPMETKMILLRSFCFVLFMSVSIFYVMRYAKKVKACPEKGLLYGESKNALESGAMAYEEIVKMKFTSKQKLSIFGFLGLILTMIYCSGALHFEFKGLSSLFLVWTIGTGILNGVSSDDICDVFVEAGKSSMYAILLLGLARTVNVVITEGNIIDTVVYYVANLISQLPNAVSAVGMLVVQNLTNFFIPSGSGQALVTMPLLVPIADIVGVSRQTTVMAFQFGDGFSNIFWPTSTALYSALVGVSMDKWYKFIGPLFGIMFLLQVALITMCVVVGI